MSNSQTVLITGASSGIGKDLAVLFAKQNFNLVLVARSEAILTDLAKKLSHEYPITTTVIAKDLSKAHAAKEILSELQSKNISIDILINNAGFGVYGLFSEVDISEIIGMLTVNISALTELTYLLIPEMKKKKNGKIMNVSSLAAFQACPLMAVYSATKAYVLSFSEALTEELKDTGISVTTFCPGVTLTAFQERAKSQNSRILKSGFNVMTSQKAAEIAFNTLMRHKPFIISGFINRLMAFAIRFTPRRFNTKLAGFLLQ